MSFIIAVHVNEGIILASDRRITYTNTIEREGTIIKNFGSHTSDSTDKTYICPNGIGISFCGDSTLNGKPISGFIKDMIRSKISKETEIDNVPQILIDYFSTLNENLNTNFIVAGYKKVIDNSQQKIYRILIKNKSIEEINTDQSGAFWDGEVFTLTRLILNLSQKLSDNVYVDLPYDEILWNYFSLQDAVDFARFAVETTINTMKFKNVVVTVGGEVDILVITPDESKFLQISNLK